MSCTGSTRFPSPGTRRDDRDAVVTSTNAPTDDIWEVLETCRAIRYLKPDPVPDAAVDKVLWAATRAPSPGNSQGWDFVVVDDVGDEARHLGRDRCRDAAVDLQDAASRPDRAVDVRRCCGDRLVAGDGTRGDLRDRPGDLSGGPPRRFVHLVGALSGGAEHPARGASARPRDGLHDPAPRRRRRDP